MANLKEYRWLWAGEQQIASDLTLNNAEFLCQSVHYRAQEQMADIELLFWEQGGVFKHSRVFSIPVQGEQEGLDKSSVARAIGLIFSAATQTFPVE